MKPRAIVRLGVAVGNGQFPVANEIAVLQQVNLVGGNSIAIQKSTDTEAPYTTFVAYQQEPGVPLVLSSTVDEVRITEPGQYRVVVNAAAADSYVLVALARAATPVYYSGVPSGGEPGKVLAKLPGGDFLSAWVTALTDAELDTAITDALALAATAADAGDAATLTTAEAYTDAAVEAAGPRFFTQAQVDALQLATMNASVPGGVGGNVTGGSMNIARPIDVPCAEYPFNFDFVAVKTGGSGLLNLVGDIPAIPAGMIYQALSVTCLNTTDNSVVPCVNNQPTGGWNITIQGVDTKNHQVFVTGRVIKSL